MKRMIATLSAMLLLLTSTPLSVYADDRMPAVDAAAKLEEWEARDFHPYYLGEDGIYYATEMTDFHYTDDVYPAGKYKRTELLRTLNAAYPKGKFEVFIEVSWGKADRFEWFHDRGYDVRILDDTVGSRWQYGVFTGEQLEDFPGDPEAGYKLSLFVDPATLKIKPEPVLGDVNNDTAIDILDVIALNKYILGSRPLDDSQQKNADVDENGVIDAGDALQILKYAIGIIDSFEKTNDPQTIDTPKGFGNYAGFAEYFEKQYHEQPVTIPSHEDYAFGGTHITLEQNRYKILMKPYSPNEKYVCPDEGYPVMLTVEFSGDYADFSKFLSAYEKMSKKIEKISDTSGFMLMDDDSLVLCGKLPDREQVFVIDAGVGDTEEGRARLQRIGEKLEILS